MMREVFVWSRQCSEVVSSAVKLENNHSDRDGDKCLPSDSIFVTEIKFKVKVISQPPDNLV